MGTFNASTVVRSQILRKRYSDPDGVVTNQVIYTPASDVEWAEVRVRNVAYDFNGIDNTQLKVDIQTVDPNTNALSTATNAKVNVLTVTEAGAGAPTLDPVKEYYANAVGGPTLEDDAPVFKLFKGERLIVNTNEGLNTAEYIAFNLVIDEYKIVS